MAPALQYRHPTHTCKPHTADTVLDSTSQLPPKLTLRVTPTLLVLVSATAPDAAYAAFSYQDLLKWGLQKGSPNEVQTMVRTRARLISTASRTWFQLQRPSHSTCNFVFRIAGSGTEVVDVRGTCSCLPFLRVYSQRVDCCNVTYHALCSRVAHAHTRSTLLCGCS
ncbi:hypothetical protein EON67_10905 [archaeon]|nr:MAG: hypothetical protein EON67_10905 [archaeon]